MKNAEDVVRRLKDLLPVLKELCHEPRVRIWLSTVDATEMNDSFVEFLDQHPDSLLRAVCILKEFEYEYNRIRPRLH